MGSGGAKTHESYAVSPAHAAAVEAGMQAVSQSELAIPESAAAVEDALKELAALAGDPESTYEDLASATDQVLAAHAQALEDGWAEQLAAESLKQLKKQTAAWLGQQPPEELQALAAAQGFEHPTLVGMKTGDGEQHPLVHWLDPAYGPSTPSKLKIQAKATERYAKLATGGTLAGLSLADVQAQEASLTHPAPAEAWQATPPQVVAAMADLNHAVAALDFHQVSEGSDGGLGVLIAAENHLAAAQCPEMAELDAAKASARAAVDKALEGSAYPRRAAIAQMVADAREAGNIGDAEAALLSPDQQLDLLRLSTPAGQRAALGMLAGDRNDQVEKLKELKGQYQESKSALGSLDLAQASGQEGLVSLAGVAGAYLAQRKQVVEWASEAAKYGDLQAELGPLYSAAYSYGYEAASLTSSFRTWAKGQKVAHLRAVAQSLGMETAGASRAQIQNFVAAAWDPKHDKAQIQAAAGAKPGGQTAKAATGGPKTVTAKTAPLSAGAGLGIPSAKSFAAKHMQIVATLKAHQAVAADLPARPGQEDVDAWEFGAGQAAALGGAHAKSLHAAPDGSMWLFKPDKTSAGARAHAEAAASAIFHRVGVPSVGVYAKRIGGKTGSIQPLVGGATQLSPDPSSWSQAELDSIVRYHVAAWAVGDHDGNHTNLLRTPSGGLLPVDQGQAFKFYGRDRLDTDYHPNGSYGAAPPVFHQAYAAASAGKLGPGVGVRPEAALPVIKSFERIPDSQYRAILRKTAAEGVKRKVGWVEPVRKAAKKRLKKTQVTDAEVADEFLRQAVERKNGLRKAFAGFLGGLGFSGAGKLEKVA